MGKFFDEIKAGLEEAIASERADKRDNKSWSTRYSKCRYCGDNSIPHRCRGLCSKCYLYIWEYVNGRRQDDDLAGYFKKIFEDHIISKG